MRTRTLLLPLLALAAACASGGGGGGGGSANVLTAAQLEPMGSEVLYNAVERTRPQWLVSRGGSNPVVFIDGINSGGTGTLRTLTAGRVEEIRYITPEAASSRFGAGYEGGVIEVTLRR